MSVTGVAANLRTGESMLTGDEQRESAGCWSSASAGNLLTRACWLITEMKLVEFEKRLKRFGRINWLLLLLLAATMTGFGSVALRFYETRLDWTASPLRRIAFFGASAVLAGAFPIVLYVSLQGRFARKLKLECPNCRTALVGQFGKHAARNDQCPVCGISILLEN